MSKQNYRSLWVRTFLITLAVLVSGIGTFLAVHGGNAHATTTTFSSNFKETVGSDVYTYTNLTPASGTLSSASLGTWDVTDNGTDLGHLGITTGDSVSGNTVTGQISMTGTGQFSSLNGMNKQASTFPAEKALTTNPLYVQDLQAGFAQSSKKAESENGDEAITMCPPATASSTACHDYGVSPTSVTELYSGSSTDPAYSGWQKGWSNENSAYNTLSNTTVSQIGPTTPSQQLVQRHGGGPLAAMARHFVWLPLAVFLVGAALATAGLMLVLYCGTGQGCKGGVTLWRSIAAVIAVAGLVLMGASFSPALSIAPAAVGAEGLELAGAAETAAVIANPAITNTGVTAVETADTFLAATSSFTSAP